MFWFDDELRSIFSTSDSVVRTNYHKYFHPKECLISNGVLNRAVSHAAASAPSGGGAKRGLHNLDADMQLGGGGVNPQVSWITLEFGDEFHSFLYCGSIEDSSVLLQRIIVNEFWPYMNY